MSKRFTFLMVAIVVVIVTLTIVGVGEVRNSPSVPSASVASSAPSVRSRDLMYSCRGDHITASLFLNPDSHNVRVVLSMSNGSDQTTNGQYSMINSSGGVTVTLENGLILTGQTGPNAQRIIFTGPPDLAMDCQK